jgi:cation-transporting ATPase 13A1
MDIFTVGVVCAALMHTFGWRLTDKEDLMAIGMLVLSIVFNGVLLLSNFWSVDAHEFFAYAKLKDGDIENCTHVKVKIDNKKQNVIKRYIVPLLHKKMELGGKVNKATQIEIMKKTFIFKKDKKTFSPIPYPVTETIEHYQCVEGLEDDLAKKKADLIYGSNKMSIPIPDFLDIYKEHLVMPFFVFQLFTTCLWLLDDYWYFSLMSLGMLFMFEGTVVFQRLMNFKRLRAMRVQPY